MQTMMITYEEPLNEHIRICLRLEHLFEQTNQNMHKEDIWASRMAISGILEALNVIDRPDFRSKLTKALMQHTAALGLLKKKENIDLDKLEEILKELDDLTRNLYYDQDKVAQILRGNSFLSNIRQHMANPGGACAYNTPYYHLWLHYSPELRQRQLREWFAEFHQISKIIKLLLKLTRNSTVTQTILAEKGFYQQTLNSKLDYHLIRVILPQNMQLYPEVSVGKHRLIIRLMKLDMEHRNMAYQEDIKFSLTCCLPFGNLL